MKEVAKNTHKREGLLIGLLFKKLAPRIGASVLLEPVWKMTGRITYKSGAQRYFRFNAVDLNPIGSARVATDKDHANFFMRELGVPTVDGKAFPRPEFAKAIGLTKKPDTYGYAKSLGFPVIVKPNSGSQGSGVFLVHTKKDLDRALAQVYKQDRIALIQRIVQGRDYRVVVLDDDVISAYERIPLNVVGDGRSTIKQLLEAKAHTFQNIGRDTKIKFNDPRIARKLERQKITMLARPKKGERVFLLDNANLSSGGDSVDVTESIHPAFKTIAIKLTKDMGLRLSGIDLLVEGGIENEPGRFSVLEINDTPGLDHYAASGPKQRKIVEDLYLKVLKAMER